MSLHAANATLPRNVFRIKHAAIFFIIADLNYYYHPFLKKLIVFMVYLCRNICNSMTKWSGWLCHCLLYCALPSSGDRFCSFCLSR